MFTRAVQIRLEPLNSMPITSDAAPVETGTAIAPKTVFVEGMLKAMVFGDVPVTVTG